jgi:hypothetical protein
MIQNVIAEDRFLEMVEDLLRHLSLLSILFGIAFDDFLLQRIDGGITCTFLLPDVSSAARRRSA